MRYGKLKCSSMLYYVGHIVGSISFQSQTLVGLPVSLCHVESVELKSNCSNQPWSTTAGASQSQRWHKSVSSYSPLPGCCTTGQMNGYCHGCSLSL